MAERGFALVEAVEALTAEGYVVLTAEEAEERERALEALDKLRAAGEHYSTAQGRARMAEKNGPAKRIRDALREANEGGYGRDAWYSYISRADVVAVLNELNRRRRQSEV